jgi:alpha-glucoside transport system permease protein
MKKASGYNRIGRQTQMKKDLVLTPRLTGNNIGNNTALALIVLAWLLPTFMLFISSIRPVDAMLTTGWWTAFAHPGQFTLENYRLVLTGKGIGSGFINSLIITIPATLLPILIGAMAAYPLSFYKFPGRKTMLITMIALQIVPLQTVLIPVLLTLKGMRLNGTFPGIWMAHAAFGLPLCIYLFRNFFAQLPYSLIEAAKIDGANHFQVFVKLIIPLSKSAFASLAIFQFLWVWNDLLVALVLLADPALTPLTVRLSSLLGSLDSGWNIMTPAAFASMLLPLGIFLAFQKYFVRGILGGAVKG